MFRLYYLDRYSCGLYRFPQSKSDFKTLEDCESFIEKTRTSPNKYGITNLTKNEQLVICEKSPMGWQIVKIIKHLNK